MDHVPLATLGNEGKQAVLRDIHAAFEEVEGLKVLTAPATHKHFRVARGLIVVVNWHGVHTGIPADIGYVDHLTRAIRALVHHRLHIESARGYGVGNERGHVGVL